MCNQRDNRYEAIWITRALIYTTLGGRSWVIIYFIILPLYAGSFGNRLVSWARLSRSVTCRRFQWEISSVVRILDCQSKDKSSILLFPAIYCHVVQLVERLSVKQVVVGSTPTVTAKYITAICC